MELLLGGEVVGRRRRGGEEEEVERGWKGGGEKVWYVGEIYDREEENRKKNVILSDFQGSTLLPS